MNIKESFDIYFELVEDPRSQAHITYQLSDILFLLIVGMLCNCTDLEMIKHIIKLLMTLNYLKFHRLVLFLGDLKKK